MAVARLTRKEQQARTRSALLAAATKVLAERGMGGSIDEIAEAAGFTKGAFYANFDSKEDLFLALLDERHAARLSEIDRAIHSGADPESQARQAGGDFITAISADPDWERLYFDFAAHATRNPGFRRELVRRNGALRERIAALLEERAAELGWDLDVDAGDVARMLFAMANGMALEKLLEPRAVSPALYGTLLTAFFGGLAPRSP